MTDPDSVGNSDLGEADHAPSDAADPSNDSDPEGVQAQGADRVNGEEREQRTREEIRGSRAPGDGPESSIPKHDPEAIPNLRHHGFSFRGSRRSLLLPDPGHEPRGEEERESIRRNRARIAGRLTETT